MRKDKNNYMVQKNSNIKRNIYFLIFLSDRRLDYFHALQPEGSKHATKRGQRPY